jgi:hypothetical protein
LRMRLGAGWKLRSIRSPGPASAFMTL